MILHDCLYPIGRPWNPTQPYPGMLPVIVDGQRFYAIKPNTGGARDLTRYDPSEAAQWPRLSPGARLVPDVESFQDPAYRPAAASIRLYPGREVDRDTNFIAQACRDTRSGSAGAPVAPYGHLPTGFNVYNALLLNDTTELAKIQADNDYIATSLIHAIDAFHPVLYCTDHSQTLWTRFAKFQISECRRLAHKAKRNIPIVPFVCPTFHPSAAGGSLAFQPIGIPYWQHILKTLRIARLPAAVLWLGQSPNDHTTWSTIEPYAKEAVK